MNYLVWAVFAVVFAIVVRMVASKLATPMEPIFWKETQTVFLSAYKASQTTLGAACRCASSNGPIAYSPGFYMDSKYAADMLSSGSHGSVPVFFKCGHGFRCGDSGDYVRAKANVRATLTVCCNGIRCVAYFNIPPGATPCTP